MGVSEHCGTRKHGRFWANHAVGVSLLAIALTACGGGSSSNSSSNSGPSITSITAACTPSSIAPDGAAQCSATVTGTGSYSSAVTWSATSGSIGGTGVFTAPGNAGSITVTATSIQDPNKSGSTTITVQSGSPGSLQVTCNPSIVAVNATSQCSATDSTGKPASAITWSATEGNISTSGLFTAPGSAGVATITATSTQNSAASGTTTVAVQSQAPPPPSGSPHIVMVVEENQSYPTVVRNTTDWPNLNQLIANGALATNYYANTHPSIGNYFMLTTGAILTNNDLSTTVWNVDNLARRMLAANIPFRIYAEGITRGYVGGDTGTYLVRHNPFALFSDIANNPQVANQTIWPFSQFATDLANGDLPEFSYVIPNIDHDAHNGTPLQADTWLQQNVVLPLSNNSAFATGGTGLLIVDFDESVDSDTQYGGGHVAATFWGPLAKTGYTQTSATIYQHQSMLSTVMSILGLSNPPGKAASAPSMSEFLQK